MKCLGRNLDDHCCWIHGKPCPFLEENSQPGFRWTCGLRRELGDWDLVLQDERYKTQVEPNWISIAEKTGNPVINCKDFPVEDCGTCRRKPHDG